MNRHHMEVLTRWLQSGVPIRNAVRSWGSITDATADPRLEYFGLRTPRPTAASRKASPCGWQARDPGRLE